jgi:hypothetical protein
MKNHYTLNPGEFFAAQELLKQRKDLKLAFPLEDEGWDLLAINPDRTKAVRLQVKESRVFRRGNSWHQVREGKLEDADVFVFVSYAVADQGARLKFHPEFLIVPATELKRLCKTKKASKGKYSFYFVKRDGRVLDIRERTSSSPGDFSEFDSAWHLI